MQIIPTILSGGSGSRLWPLSRKSYPKPFIALPDGETLIQGDHLITSNESTSIPAGETHRLSNPGVIDLHLIEVQSGAYLGEDDIVRLEDIYGRALVEPDAQSGSAPIAKQ